MLKRLMTLACVATSLAFPMPVAAHFQLAYTPEVNPVRAGDLPVRLIFWHPWSAGHAMDMPRPEKVEIFHRGEVLDVTGELEAYTFRTEQNTAQSWRFDMSVKSAGDYIIAVTPTPYLEAAEDIYIQQFTKSFVSRAGVPTGWNEALGLAAEIVPLVRPTNVMTGSTFSGQVFAGGVPVPNAVLEVEYLAAPPNIETEAAPPALVPMAAGGVVQIVADANGLFTFGIPKAGFWGFAALAIGPQKEFDGKPLSQDAVIWIRAYDLE